MRRFLPPPDKGWMLEISGDPGVGKTSLGLYLAAVRAKQDGRRVLLIDGGGVSRLHTDALGKALDYFDVLSPDGGETTLESVIQALSSGGYCCVVIDDLLALVPADTFGVTGGENRAQALMYSRYLPEVKRAATDHRALVILVNQLRYRRDFGAEYTACGKAPRLLSDDRLLVKRGQDFASNEAQGFEVLVRRIRTDLGSEEGVRLYLVYGKGLKSGDTTRAAGVVL